MTSHEMAMMAVKALDSKKAEDISVLEIGNLTTLGDYFVVASGGSTIQVKALADEVEERLSKDGGQEPKRIEGYQSANWILLDYYGVIVHIFLGEVRQFYALERLWADAPRLNLADIVTEN